MDIPHHRADAHPRARSEVIVSARKTQLDTIGSPPAVAIPRNGGSVRRVSSSLRAVTSLGKVPVRVGATPVPHAEILDHVRDILARQGFDLQIEIFETFDEPNDRVAEGHLDANFFQYLPFLDEFNHRSGAGLVPIVPVHIEPFGLYSTHITDLDDIPDHAEIALPGDPVNASRSLAMLDDLGLIECAVDPHTPASVLDIRRNPYGLVLKEVSSSRLAQVREDFDIVFLFGNQAMGLGVDTGTALYCDRGNAAYAEYLVTRPDNWDSPAVCALAAALQSESTRDFLATAYRGQLIPAF
jgi:D-methionine transport system substrate-binding protein